MFMCSCGRWMIRKYVSSYGFCYYYDYCPYCEKQQYAADHLDAMIARTEVKMEF